jgi:hypothetical protein
MATPPDAQARTEKSATDFRRAVIARKTLFDFKGKAMMPMPPMAMFTLHGMNERFQSPVGHSGAENPSSTNP